MPFCDAAPAPNTFKMKFEEIVGEDSLFIQIRNTSFILQSLPFEPNLSPMAVGFTSQLKNVPPQYPTIFCDGPLAEMSSTVGYRSEIASAW